MLDILDNPMLKNMLSKQLKKYFAEKGVHLITISLKNGDLNFEVYTAEQKVMPQTDFDNLIRTIEL